MDHARRGNYARQIQSTGVSMELIKSVRSPRPWLGAAVAAGWCSGGLSLPGRAADLAGLYAGGAFCPAQVEAGTPSLGSFQHDHSAYQLIAGLRPLAPFRVQ